MTNAKTLSVLSLLFFVIATSFVTATATATGGGGHLPEKVFWDNHWPSDLTLPKPREEQDDNVDDDNNLVVVWSLQEPYSKVEGQTALNSIGNDVEAIGLAEIYRNNDNNDQVLVRTWNGAWLRNFYLPSPTTLKIGSKFQINCRSSWYVNVIIQEDDVRRVNNGEELLLIVLYSNDNDGTQVWYSENEYIPPPTSEPTSSPTSAPTSQSDKKYELLEGTVLFAQSQIIPSKQENGILNDNQPHLTSLRKTLVMMRPHCLDDDNDNDNDNNGVSPCRLFKGDNSNGDGTAAAAEIQMTVRNGEGTILNNSPIVMAEPKDIPKQTGWIELGNDVSVDELDIPSTLEGGRYILQGQSNLNTIGNDEEARGLLELLNTQEVASLTNQHQVEIKTSDGSWVRNIYLPSAGGAGAGDDSSSIIPSNTKVQVTCNSGYTVHLWYPNTQTGGFRQKILKRGDTIVAMLVNNGSTWVTHEDLTHNDYVFGHHFYTTTLDANWVVPGMTLEFSIEQDADADADADEGAVTVVTMGVLDDIDIGGVTELVITTLDAGFLTEPRNKFTFANDEELHREYFQTTLASRLIVVQYESMYLEEIMLPTGTFYEKGTSSETDGGWHSGDMRQFIGKVLLSHGIDLANYGISSSLSGSESPHPFTCALLAAHNTVGMYQNGRQVHGGSGGNGMITLDNSVGNEFSHEVGHNYGLGHYVDGFNGSVHRAANEINSSWGWDSQTNIFTPNFASSNTGKDRCLDDKCQPAFDGRFQFGTDSMAGGSPAWGSNRYTMYTPNSSKKIQSFLERKAVFDPSSSTGFSKYDSTTKQMKEFINNQNNQKVPRLYRVPVTTIVGYYDPNYSVRNLESYIYPAMHGAYGFVYNDDDSTTTTTDDSSTAGCELVVTTSNNGALKFDLSTSIDSGIMNKFHVNIATDDEPYEAKVYCQNVLLANRALEGPNSDEPPLTYTVTGVPFPINDNDDNDDEESTESPTTRPTTAEPTNSPTTSPTTAEPTNSPTTGSPTSYPTWSPTVFPTKSKSCADQTDFLWKNKPKKNCQWAGKGSSTKKMKKKCEKKNRDGTNVAYYCRQTCATVGVGPCK